MRPSATTSATRRPGASCTSCSASAMHPRAVAAAQRGEVAAAEARRSGIRSLDARDEVQQRALAGAVRAEQGADRAARHGAVDVVDDEPAPAGEADPVGAQGVEHRVRRSS